MRILVVSDLYPPQIEGGHEIQICAVADELSRRGHEVAVLTSRLLSKRSLQDSMINRILYVIEQPKNGGLRKQLMQVGAVRLARLNGHWTKKVVRAFRPDVAYIGQLCLVSVAPLIALQKCEVPIVHHLGNYFYANLATDFVQKSSALKRFWHRVLVRTLDPERITNLIVVSDAVRQRYIQAGFYENRISVTPLAFVPSSAISANALSLRGDCTSALKVLFAGRLTQEKGVHVALSAVARIASLGGPGIQMDIFGEGDADYIEMLLSLCERKGIQRYVRFVGRTTREDLLSRYRNYDMLLFPSIWEEPLAGVLVEAMSQGLPVVATMTGGTPELVVDGKNGILVPAGNSQAMADAALRLAGDAVLYRRISEGAIRTISAGFTTKIIVDKVEAHLSAAAKAPVQPSVASI